MEENLPTTIPKLAKTMVSIRTVIIIRKDMSMLADAGVDVLIMDVTSGAVYGLCEAWRNGAEIDSGTIRINLLFDLDNNDIELKSSLPLLGRLRFFKKSDKDMYLRIPSWVDTKTLQLEVQGKTVEYPVIENGYLHVGILKKGDIGTILFDVPCLVNHEKIEDQDYRVT